MVACRQQGAGVVGQVGRIVRVLDGRPITDDGPESSAALDISTVVWCTGSDADDSWLNPPVLGSDGLPEHHRGVCHAEPGL